MEPILIVDDRLSNREMLETFLNSHNYKTFTAENGRVALDILEKNSVELIISDIMMPEIDGYVLCQKVKTDTRWAHIPFIFYSETFTSRADEIFAIKLGATKFVRKSTNPSKFLDIIKEVLQNRIEGDLTTASLKFKDEKDIFRVYNQRIVKKLEEKAHDLEVIESRLSKALEIAKLGYWDFDVEKNIFSFDDHFYSIFHTTAEKEGGYTMTPQQYSERFVHPDDRQLIGIEIQNALDATDQNFNKKLEHRILYADGGTGFISVNYFIEKNNQGKTIKSYGVNQDITDHKLIEVEKRSLENQLLQAQKMEAVGNLAGGIAHDFNNLLTVIQGHTQLLMMNMEENDPDFRELKLVLNATTKAANLTRKLLLFSRKQAIEVKTLNINATITDMLKMIKRLIGENIKIITNLKKDLWNIEADEGNLEQVIVNLVVNASDAMESGGTLTIQTENVRLSEAEAQFIQYARPGKFIHLFVKDTGKGIDGNVIHRIFDPFYTTKEAGKGTGLGLSVVYGIIKKHNGWINVNSTIDQGTIFDIYLPASDKNIVEFEEKSKTYSFSKGHGEKILVVEDDNDLLNFTTTILRQNEYTPLSVKSGVDAMKKVNEEKNQIRLIICDIVLPDINGYKLIEQITEKYPQIPVIFSSGYIQEQIVELIQKNRNFSFLQKPYQVNDLLEAVSKIFNK